MLDVFPARAEGPDGQEYSTVRVLIMDDDRMVLFQDHGQNGVQAMVNVAVSGYDSNGNTGNWTVTTTEGTTWQVTRQGGCGCGNRLKTLTARRLAELVNA